MLNKAIVEKSLGLNDIDKIHLIETLLDSLDRPAEEVQALWVEEAEARYDAYKKGKIKGIPFEQVMKKYL